MEVCEFAFAMVVVAMGDSYRRPSSEAVDRRICRGECDVREYVPVNHPACAGVCLVIVDNSIVGFPDVGKLTFSSLVLMRALSL